MHLARPAVRGLIEAGVPPADVEYSFRYVCPPALRSTFYERHYGAAGPRTVEVRAGARTVAAQVVHGEGRVVVNM